MASVEVKNQRKTEGNQQTGLQNTERTSGVSRTHAWDPFSLIPSDFFGADPFSLMRRFQQEMDRSFERFFGAESGSGTRDWNPAIEVAKRDGQLFVHAELPGLKPEEVKVEVTDNALVIEGERRYEHEDKQGGVYRSERHYGKFYRQIPLPEGTSADQAKAQFRDGVLEVSMPVAEQKSNRRSIKVETGTPSEPKPEQIQ
jgi:HSP20 family protein